jgi:Ca2+-binding RTX toxin-like protein
MADFLGIKNNDSLTGTSADDRYLNVGVGTDTIKDPGGKDTVDISGATVDSTAKTFTTTDQLVAEFSIQGGTGSSTETFIETFVGTSFNDTIAGNNLSNNIDGGAGDDTIGGVNAAGTNPGKGEIDTLTGGTGKDVFVLGSGSTVYYDDSDVATSGTADYALITDFNPADFSTAASTMTSSSVKAAVISTNTTALPSTSV